MATTDVNYHVKVPLDPTDLPTSDQTVIWDSANGKFNLGSGTGGSTTTCLSAQTANAAQITFSISGVSDINDSCLKGELYGKVTDGSRYQLARITIGWEDNDDITTRVTAVEDVRYPDSRVIYNINSFAVSWQSTTSFNLTFNKYITDTTVDFCLNYITF